MRTVFLSSTAKDLAAHREATRAAIERLDGYHCVCMEDFGARSEQPTDLCVEKIRQCNVVVFLIGPCYGSRNPKGISFTQSEYEAAVQTKKYCLVFMTTADFPLPASLREDDESAKAQEAFRALLQKAWTVKAFTRAEELPGFVSQAISNWQAQQSVSAVRWRKVAPVEELAWTQCEGTDFGVGRSPDNAICVDDAGVSWEHGTIFRRKGAFWYRHLSNKSPSFISQPDADVMLKPGDSREVLLHSQDRLKVGNTTLVLQFDLARVDLGWTPTTTPPES